MTVATARDLHCNFRFVFDNLEILLRKMTEFGANLGELKGKRSVKLSKTGKVLIGITGGIALGLTALCAPFISPALRKVCLPYVPATDRQISNVLQALGGAPRRRLVDLGSGDGRIVLETAAISGKDAQHHGVELNPWLVIYSKFDARRKGVSDKVKFFRRDLWKFDVSNYDDVIIFGVEQMMVDLEKKILKECKKDCKIVACRFPLPNLTPVLTIGEGVDTVWLYHMPRPITTQTT